MTDTAVAEKNTANTDRATTIGLFILDYPLGFEYLTFMSGPEKRTSLCRFSFFVLQNAQVTFKKRMTEAVKSYGTNSRSHSWQVTFYPSYFQGCPFMAYHKPRPGVVARCQDGKGRRQP
ncbi:hypothetical protein NVIE_0459 [Nitrososphaera viennensis EN76]|uniref:Uncharacterized protein n=1 Tax=Nitrososphaera viennensis EN76 TaxID=926571 RepID=A0A060HH23_9ARCH|nr:hypothetical protein NVIE_0459 [Nitrososphaera viennensis EN76]